MFGQKTYNNHIIDNTIKEKVKHEVHWQLNSDMKTILKDEITASNTDKKNTVIADLSQIVNDNVDNLKDNEECKLKIIVFGAEESVCNLKKTRETNDTKVFIETFQNEVKINISSNDISKITCLGRKKEDGTPRPILVSMSSQDVKKKDYEKSTQP